LFLSNRAWQPYGLAFEVSAEVEKELMVRTGKEVQFAVLVRAVHEDMLVVEVLIGLP